MTKDNIIEAIVKKTGVAKTQANDCLNVLLDEITKSLSRGEEVVLTGFGKFKITQRKEREGRNPKTGETIKIAAKKAPVFKAGSILKFAVK
ncbi:MAG: HU family DNA-binding protein [Candidatus Nealsonbacteria bacterium]